MEKKAVKKMSSFFSWAMPSKRYAIPFNDGWAEEKGIASKLTYLSPVVFIYFVPISIDRVAWNEGS
ncbi:hypothetical protein EON65_15690 [archaeon]|nr:MAG: hypothetical protein EON65_15690 [archaeon]